MKNFTASISTLFMAAILAAPLSARETGLAGTAPLRLARGNVTAQAAGPAATVLNINNIQIWVDKDGFFPWTIAASGAAAEYPKGTGSLIFAEGILWGAKVDDAGTRDGTQPRIRVNGSTYATGMKAGKVLYDVSGNVTGADEVPEDRHVWRVRRDYLAADLTEDAASFFVKPSDGVTAEDIQAVHDQYDFDWQNWPAAEGAPFEDVDGNGSYDPLVDIPGEPGAAQTIWLVANDLPFADGTEVAPNSYGSTATGMELQLTLWAYDFPPDQPLGNMLFKRARLIYTGLAGGPADAKLDTVYFTQWSDPDLGDFTDDFVGSDSTLSLGYVYNGNALDGIFNGDFGLPVPAGGYDLLQGPIVAGDTLGMTSFGWFGAGSAISDPDLGNYSGTLQWFNLMEGFLPRPGYPAQTPWTDDAGAVTKFPLAGDPVAGTGDIDGLLLAPGDRRLLLNTGPFQMALGDTQEVVVALIGGLGVDNLTSLSVLRHYDRFAQAAYDHGFELPTPPPAPVVDASGLDGRVVLTWGAEGESAASSGYQFEGYKIYMGTSAAGPWEHLAAFDVQNGVAVILDEVFDPELGVVITIPIQFGSDSGIQRFFEIDTDVFGNPLVNGETYYFAVTRYDYRPLADGFPRALESNIEPIEVMPIGPIMGYDYDAATADSSAAHATGPSSGFVLVEVVDASAVTGHTYQVVFQEIDGQIVWDLVDFTLGQVILLDNQTNQSGDEDYEIVDGLLVKVIGPPIDFQSFEAVANSAGPIDPPTGAAADFQGFPVPMRPGDEQQVGAGKWMFHTGDDAGGTRGSYEAFLSRTMRGTNFDRAVPFDFEMRFTAAGSYAVRSFEDEVVIPVPFELWNIGIATPDDPSDDYRMIPWLGTVEAFGGVSLNPDGYSVEPTDHSASGGDNDPFTPWIYWRQPDDFTAGTAGYDAYVDSLDLAADPPNGGSYLFDGAEVFARTVLINWNGGSVADTATFRSTVNQLVPEEGTVFRIITTKPNTTSDVFVFTTTAPTVFTALKGDVNLDGNVDVADVVALVNIILKIDTPLGEQEYAGDMNGDYRLNILDVIGVINKALGLGKRLAAAEDLEEVTLGIPEQVAILDGRVSVPLELEAGQPVAGLQLVFSYNPGQLRPLAPSFRGEQWEGISVLDHIQEPGKVIYLIYSLQGRSLPSLEGMRISFELIGKRGDQLTKISLASAVLASANGRAADIVFGNRDAEIGLLPTSYTMYPTYPNPFNPVTTLRYDLPEPGRVAIRIYNLLGQKVRTLVNQDVSAGRHMVQWQGRDDRGNAMSTGIYFIQFQSGGVVQHQKVTLLK